MTRVMRLDAERWADVVARAEAAATGDATAAGAPDPLVAAVAQHLAAPVRASLVATSADAGTITRLTLVADRALLVTHPIAELNGETRTSGDALLAFARPEEIWPAVASSLPALDALRAPGVATGSVLREAGELDGEPAMALLEREEAGLQVEVGAWRDAGSPAVVWARLWSVVDGRLFDVRRSDGRVRLAERPHGAVAAELEWALAGAVEAVAEHPPRADRT